MKNVSKETITKAFLEYCGKDTKPRTFFLLKKLVEHLHEFAKETELTHEEWLFAIDFLTRAGQITDKERNEFILLSDTVGLSSLIDMLGSQHEGTSSSVLGPFHIASAPELPVGGDLCKSNEGSTVVLEGYVRDNNGNPIPNAVIEIWQTADNGLYSNQDPDQEEYNLRCSMKVSTDGRYALTTVRPAPYKVPDDGPVGELLRATGRNAWRPSHFHFIISAKGYRQLVTELFPADDPHLDSDAVFGVREDLILVYKEMDDLKALPDDLSVGKEVSLPFFKVDFNFVLIPLKS